MPGRACQNARDELIACLLRSDWSVLPHPSNTCPLRAERWADGPTSVLKTGKTPRECVRSSSELPLQCQHLITNYADCKKGMVRFLFVPYPSVGFSLRP